VWQAGYAVPMRIVVIGATGNCGTSLLEALATEDRVTEVLGIARRRPAAEFAKTTFVEADITSDDLRPHLRGADAVVHLAWLIQPTRDESVTHAVNVQGSANVFEAVAKAKVPRLIYNSSIGAYAEGPKDRGVDESWSTAGIPTSYYSRHKAATERMLDAFESAHGDVRVVRLRPGLVFKREAATQIRRLFAGPLLPNPLLRRTLIPVFPDLPRLRVQAVHSKDLGHALRLAIVDDDARGAFNVAAEPVLDAKMFARLLGARTVPVPAGVARVATDLTWRAHLHPVSPGWLDMGLGVPLMDTTRAREELGWTPRFTAAEAFDELFDGIRESAELDTPPLARSTSGPGRIREVLTGVGHSGR
jgi:UDP-glucose 4-epimerase